MPPFKSERNRPSVHNRATIKELPKIINEINDLVPTGKYPQTTQENSEYSYTKRTREDIKAITTISKKEQEKADLIKTVLRTRIVCNNQYDLDNLYDFDIKIDTFRKFWQECLRKNTEKSPGATSPTDRIIKAISFFVSHPACKKKLKYAIQEIYNHFEKEKIDFSQSIRKKDLLILFSKFQHIAESDSPKNYITEICNDPKLANAFIIFIHGKYYIEKLESSGNLKIKDIEETIKALTTARSIITHNGQITDENQIKPQYNKFKEFHTKKQDFNKLQKIVEALAELSNNYNSSHFNLDNSYKELENNTIISQKKLKDIYSDLKQKNSLERVQYRFKTDHLYRSAVIFWLTKGEEILKIYTKELKENTYSSYTNDIDGRQANNYNESIFEFNQNG